jgi:OmpA family protein
MLKSLLAAVGVALLLGACDSPQPQAVAPPPPPPAAAPTYMVFFDWDRSNLSAQALATIKQASDAYRATGSARIQAIGHTDTSGPENYNMALSLRRANTVKGALVNNGVPASAIETIGRGESMPLVATGDGVREPQNRRVEITGLAGATQATGIFADPRAYCKALSDKWRQYRTSQVDTPEAQAIAKCEAGNYAEGIPTLEDALIAGKIPLPQPGYRWPGRSYSPS